MRGEALRAREVQFAATLALITVAIRLWMVRRLTFCGTPDACYYLGMAQSLAGGTGFHARFLYDFQLKSLSLPNTGIEYWRPGISLLLAALHPFGATTLHGSILLTTLVGVVFAAAAWHIAMQSSGDRRLALAAFALCLLGPSAWNGSLSPDSGLYYGSAVAWFLALFTVRRQGLWQDLLALLCIGLAYLIRNDAALLLLPLLAVLWARHRRHARTGEPAQGSSLGYAAAILAGFVLALLPMHLIYRAVLGTAFPAGTAQVLFLNDLGDFSSYAAPVSAHTLLAHGLKHLVLFRVSTFATVVYRIGALIVGYAALVFLPALFLRDPHPAPAGTNPRRLPELTGAAVFSIAALFIYTWILPAIGGFSALRTAEGVIPLISVLVVVAIARAAATARIAAVLAAAVILANAVAGIMADARDVATMNGTGADIRAEAAALRRLGANPASAVILTQDPVQFSVTTGFASVALPNNGLDAIAHAAHDFHASHVILNADDLPAPTDGIDRALGPRAAVPLPPEHSLVLALGPATAAQVR